MAKYTGPAFTSDDFYSASTLTNKYSAADLRKQYTKMRDIAQKRLKALGAKYPRSQTYLKNRDLFPATKTFAKGEKGALANKLIQLDRFLNQKTSKLSGMKAHRAATLKGLSDKGYDFVTDKSLDLFGEFMDYNRALRKGGMYDSEHVAALVEWAKEEQISSEDLRKEFEYWMEAVYIGDGDMPEISDYYKTSRGKLYATKRALEKEHGKGTVQDATDRRKADAEEYESVNTMVRRNRRR